MSYESTLTRDANGYCKLFGLEYRIWLGRKWRRCSLTMHDRHAIEQQAELLAAQDNWSGWRVIEVA